MQWKYVFNIGAVLAVVLSVVSCEETSFKDSFLVFGTTVQLEMVGEPQQKSRQVSREIQQKFDALHLRWHAWEQGGLLAKINHAIANGEPMVLQPQVAEFLQVVQALSLQSDGLFNPALGKLVALWGFHADVPQPLQPSKKDIEKYTVPPLSMAGIRLENNTLFSSDPRIKLDLGAVAKGYALDLAIETLRARNIKHAVINAGGDMRVLGDKFGKPWRIGVRAPKGGVLGGLDIFAGEAVVTSGDYARQYAQDNKQRHHIIAPHSGQPTVGLQAVTVVLPDAPRAGMRADAIATALMVAGKEKWRAIAQRMEADTVLVVENTGKLWMTKKMQKRFEPL